MAFDFPSSPTTGQTYSISGGPTYVYNGTAWVVLTPGNQFNRTVFTATAGQTTFTMNYVVGAIDVYRNGVKLVNTSDFTATNGTSIVLLNASTAGDTIEVISYPMITYSDAVKRTGDTMTGNLDITAQLKVSGAMTTISPTTKGIYAGFDPSAANNIGIDVVTGTNGIAWVDFHDGAGTDYKGRIAYANSSNQLAIYSGGNLGINIDSVGRVAVPNQPSFYAKAGRTENGYGNNINMTYTNVIRNVGNHYNSSAGIFTAPVNGFYCFFGQLYKEGNNNLQMYVRVNGVAFNEPARVIGDWTTSHSGIQWSTCVPLSANDSVSFYISPGFYCHLNQDMSHLGGYLIG